MPPKRKAPQRRKVNNTSPGESSPLQEKQNVKTQRVNSKGHTSRHTSRSSNNNNNSHPSDGDVTSEDNDDGDSSGNEICQLLPDSEEELMTSDGDDDNTKSKKNTKNKQATVTTTQQQSSPPPSQQQRKNKYRSLYLAEYHDFPSDKKYTSLKVIHPDCPQPILVEFDEYGHLHALFKDDETPPIVNNKKKYQIVFTNVINPSQNHTIDVQPTSLLTYHNDIVEKANKLKTKPILESGPESYWPGVVRHCDWDTPQRWLGALDTKYWGQELPQRFLSDLEDVRSFVHLIETDLRDAMHYDDEFRQYFKKCVVEESFLLQFTREDLDMWCLQQYPNIVQPTDVGPGDGSKWNKKPDYSTTTDDIPPICKPTDAYLYCPTCEDLTTQCCRLTKDHPHHTLCYCNQCVGKVKQFKTKLLTVAAKCALARKSQGKKLPNSGYLGDE